MGRIAPPQLKVNWILMVGCYSVRRRDVKGGEKKENHEACKKTVGQNIISAFE